MKANQTPREEDVRRNSAFTFIVPMTMAIVVGFALLIIGAYVIGTIGSALEDSFPSNTASGSIDNIYYHNASTSGSRSISLPTEISALDLTTSRFSIIAVESDLDYNLIVNGNIVNLSSNLTKDGDPTTHNTTFSFLIGNSSVNSTDTVLNFDWTVSMDGAEISIRVYSASFFYSSDYRSSNENKTVYLLGNVADGFSSVVDIEIVVILITVLSMAIITIMAVGSRRQMF